MCILRHPPVPLCFHQARYQKERAANRRNEILLDQLCTEIEVKAVAVQNQQVLTHSAVYNTAVDLTRTVSRDAHKRALCHLSGGQSLCVSCAKSLAHHDDMRPHRWSTSG